MSSKLEIGGLWPALLTPVDTQGAPAYAELEKIVQLCIDQQLDGIYLLGSTGQGVLFSEKDRIEITKQVMNIAGNSLPVIAQVGALNTHESVRLAKAAQEAGVYGISSVAPIYYQGGVQNSLAHYRAISSSIDIPFFPYHVGNQSVFGGDARYYIDQILTLPNIEGMKLTTQNLYEISLMHILAGDDLILFSGADELFCQATLCGTAGAIGSFFNLWGEECQFVRKEFIGGNFDLGSRFMLTFQEIINFVLPNIWTFLQKAMYLKHGIAIGIPNPPLGMGNTQWQDKDVQDILDRIAAVTGLVTK
ncbi:dihydrodipicolinate synthase family protein [Dyadobacter frigoris]|uniref:Dihydrodipicolinate synthase family protein n=1 Tax=Dyadobacter frigoris TaxID=2576211 RepID=A0A4U6CTM7_9BACT|nr:dihydrodipicolinate synthase family protein [Dyadobacter frigoris]TKT87942.1 dihydrodipicolinate synthase family protein [Dyadobacter frigoris]